MDVIDRGWYAGGFNIPYDVFELGVVAQALQDEFDCGSFVVDVGVFGADHASPLCEVLLDVF